MIISNAYNYINVLSKASSAAMTRQEVITNNIANVDTPNFKRQDVSFEKALRAAVGRTGTLDENINNIRLDSINESVYTDTSSLSYRLDGNNVDIDTENAYLAENQLRYYTLIDSMKQEFRRITSVIK
ncbi:MAG: flagellar basal body rod protein FlgB [Lachnospiraceae bacterium]|nr:flagellar basal body rod protein FlgB [Lachnospiraceae bacterium]